MKATAQDGETVDAICWRVLGRTAKVTEQALAMNPGLGDIGAQLPGGTVLTLPDIIDAPAETRVAVKLWD